MAASSQIDKRRRSLGKTFQIDLINEYRKHPGLYDRDNPIFHDSYKSDLEWKDISDKLGHDVSFLQRHILYLRDRLSSENRRIIKLLEENPKLIKVEVRWPLYRELQFLSKHLTHRFNKRLASFSTICFLLRGQSHSGASNISSNGLEQGDRNLYLNAENGEVETYSLMNDDMESAQSLVTIEMKEEDPENLSLDKGDLSSADPPHLHQQRVANIEVSDEKPSITSSAEQTSIREYEEENLNVAYSSTLMMDTISSEQVQYSSSQFDQDDVSIPTESERGISEECVGAFGDFVVSSLRGLPQHSAYAIIEKFTSELLTALESASSPTYP